VARLAEGWHPWCLFFCFFSLWGRQRKENIEDDKLQQELSHLMLDINLG
jgi:hypothetical protein